MHKALALAAAIALLIGAPVVHAQEKPRVGGILKVGDYNTLGVARRELRGDFRTAPRLYSWNSWLAR